MSVSDYAAFYHSIERRLRLAGWDTRSLARRHTPTRPPAVRRSTDRNWRRTATRAPGWQPRHDKQGNERGVKGAALSRRLLTVHPTHFFPSQVIKVIKKHTLVWHLQFRQCLEQMLIAVTLAMRIDMYEIDTQSGLITYQNTIKNHKHPKSASLATCVLLLHALTRSSGVEAY